MLQSVLTGMILENIETLKHYQAMKDSNRDTVENILQYVSGVITGLPWYFRLPVIMLANSIGLLCLMTTGHNLDVLSAEKRAVYLHRVQFIPFFDMLNKLVRSMALLKLFDCLPFETDYINNFDFPRN